MATADAAGDSTRDVNGGVSMASTSFVREPQSLPLTSSDISPACHSMSYKAKSDRALPRHGRLRRDVSGRSRSEVELRARRPIRWRDVFVRWVFSASRVGFASWFDDVGGVREMPMERPSLSMLMELSRAAGSEAAVWCVVAFGRPSGSK